MRSILWMHAVLTLLSVLLVVSCEGLRCFPAFAVLCVYGCIRLIVKLYFCSCRTSERNADAIVMEFSF